MSIPPRRKTIVLDGQPNHDATGHEVVWHDQAVSCHCRPGVTLSFPLLRVLRVEADSSSSPAPSDPVSGPGRAAAPESPFPRSPITRATPSELPVGVGQVSGAERPLPFGHPAAGTSVQYIEVEGVMVPVADGGLPSEDTEVLG
jgi:hypothetical protein